MKAITVGEIVRSGNDFARVTGETKAQWKAVRIGLDGEEQTKHDGTPYELRITKRTDKQVGSRSYWHALDGEFATYAEKVRVYRDERCAEKKAAEQERAERFAAAKAKVEDAWEDRVEIPGPAEWTSIVMAAVDGKPVQVLVRLSKLRFSVWPVYGEDGEVAEAINHEYEVVITWEDWHDRMRTQTQRPLAENAIDAISVSAMSDWLR